MLQVDHQPITTGFQYVANVPPMAIGPQLGQDPERERAARNLFLGWIGGLVLIGIPTAAYILWRRAQ